MKINTTTIKWTPYHFRNKVYNTFWLLGFSIHNHIDNECCPDFSCCFPELQKPLHKRIRYCVNNIKKK